MKEYKIITEIAIYDIEACSWGINPQIPQRLIFYDKDKNIISMFMINKIIGFMEMLDEEEHQC